MSDTIKSVRKKRTISAEGRKRMAQGGRAKNPNKGFGSNRDLARKAGKARTKQTKQV